MLQPVTSEVPEESSNLLNFLAPWILIAPVRNPLEALMETYVNTQVDIKRLLFPCENAKM